MCGILFRSRAASIGVDQVGVGRAKQEALWKQLRAAVSKRGPDWQREIEYSGESEGLGHHGKEGSVEAIGVEAVSAVHPFDMSVFSSVLHLRGPRLVPQPVTRTHVQGTRLSHSFLCWNGELFADSNDSSAMNVPVGSSDTEILAQTLFDESVASTFKTNLLHTLSRLRGPWAILVFDAPSSTLYFGRDFLGRRSLLAHFPDQVDPSFYISSVSAGTNAHRNTTRTNATAAGNDDALSEVSGDDDLWWGDSQSFWLEVPANGIYSICFNDLDAPHSRDSFRKHLVQIPWSRTIDSGLEETLTCPANDTLNTEIPNLDPTSLDTPPNAPDSILNVPMPTTTESIDALETATSLLSASVKARIETIPSIHQNWRQKHTSNILCESTSIDTGVEPLAILFSGGLDCMILAALAAQKFGDSGAVIDLLNVAFDNPRVRNAAAKTRAALDEAKAKKLKKDKRKKKANPIESNHVVEKDEGVVNDLAQDASPPSNFANEKELENLTLEQDAQQPNLYPSHLFAVPDRKTGLKGYEELKLVYPHVTWRFVEIDVAYEEAQEMKPHIMELMHPLESVMDLSIALAFWFASRGAGSVVHANGVNVAFYAMAGSNLRNIQDRVAYKSAAKVLLSGLGADEQCGGYNRHRKSFDSSGWQGLILELQKDVSRISKRNLGRDDRIVSDHGREIRFPYLAESVVSMLSKLPVHLKTDPRLPRGVGDKLLLRQMAVSLGLDRASVEAKRAVQFGARTAKMEDGREKGAMKLT
ncbi:Asparagine synthetase domain-containing protein 1 [Chytriomyces hyalinus]|nr:Asparagine synthetase domain-containing protein 1 [Chytriomyces hyalinus]